jgi:16S rRNA (guanine527-N7)-methyltransferase
VQSLGAAAAALGLPLDGAQLASFRRYAELLLAANRRVNLTSIVDREAVEARHFLDSLTCAGPLLARWGSASAVPSLRCADVGSGGGFPGVPLALALPQLRLTLIEATARKAWFLGELIAELRLSGVQVAVERAETLAHQSEHREAYDAAFARALAPLPTLLELTLPFLRVGGLLVAPRKGDPASEQASSEAASALLGGGAPRAEPVTVPALADGRVLTIVEKERPTPAAYPRRPGMPAKRPLPGR